MSFAVEAKLQASVNVFVAASGKLVGHRRLVARAQVVRQLLVHHERADRHGGAALLELPLLQNPAVVLQQFLQVLVLRVGHRVLVVRHDHLAQHPARVDQGLQLRALAHEHVHRRLKLRLHREAHHDDRKDGDRPDDHHQGGPSGARGGHFFASVFDPSSANGFCERYHRGISTTRRTGSGASPFSAGFMRNVTFTR